MTTSRRRHRSRSVDSDDHQVVDEPARSEPSAHPETSDESRSIESLGLQFAGPLRRVYAFAIDIGILLMLVFILGPILGNSEGIFNIPNVQTGVIDVFIFLAYFIIPTGFFGRTIGKWVAGISVVDEDGNKPGVAVAIPREMVGRFVATITFFVGIIWIVFDKNHQGWHDKIAGTYVVVVPNSGGPGFLARMFAPREDEEKTKSNRRQRVGRPTGRRKRRRNRRRG